MVDEVGDGLWVCLEKLIEVDDYLFCELLVDGHIILVVCDREPGRPEKALRVSLSLPLH